MVLLQEAPLYKQDLQKSAAGFSNGNSSTWRYVFKHVLLVNEIGDTKL